MDLLKGPTRVFDLSELPRYCGGKPAIEKIAWFRDQVYWHQNSLMDADNISFVLEEDPGEKLVLCNDIEIRQTLAPRIDCAHFGSRLTTIATVRRNELLLRYRHEDMTIPEYPFSDRHFIPTPRFWKSIYQLAENLNHLLEPGIADQIDLIALQMITEALVSAKHADSQQEIIDPRINQIANRITASPEQDFDISSLASEYGFSRAAFYREWNKYSDESPYNLLLTNRLRLASELLSMTHLPIKEVAFRSGFRSHPVFTEMFSQRFGISPREYRRKQEAES